MVEKRRGLERYLDFCLTRLNRIEKHESHFVISMVFFAATILRRKSPSESLVYCVLGRRRRAE